MIDNFEKTFENKIKKDENGHYQVERENLLEIATFLKENCNFAMLLDVTCIDYLTFVNKQKSRYAVVYLLRHADFDKQIFLKVFVPEDLFLPSLTKLYDSANWAEREVWDQYGISFALHPNLKRVLNHKQFVGHPLRKDYPITKGQLCTETDDLMDEMNDRLKQKEYKNKDELLYLNMGPAHPASHGTIRTLVALEGESIISAVSEIGYLHRGFEKSCENHTYNQIIPYTDRLNYCSAILNNIGFAHAIESMLGVTIPLRGQYIRVIIGELSRIIDHLVCVAAGLVDMGALTNYWYLYNPRETVYNLLSKLTGARLTNSYMRIGGMSHDFYEGCEEEIEACLRDVEEGMGDTLALVEKNRIFHDRTQNVGVVTAEEAINKGFTGPNLRASGVNYDIRSSAPYYIYNELDFKVALGSVGDVYDRLMVRFEEIRQSISMIRQALKTLPKGEICVNDASISLPKKENVYGNIEGVMNQFKLIYEGVKVPKMEHYSATEAGNGELGFFIVSDGTGTPYKVKVRPPCFPAMASLPDLVEGGMVSDYVLCLGSLNIIAGELDR